ncbi:MAG: SNF2-related protein [Bacteroidia bacterium]
MKPHQIDASQPFEIIYSFYNHQCLGYLLAATVVPVMSNGMLSLAYKNLKPSNARPFLSKLGETDQEIIKLCYEMSPRNIAKQFGKETRDIDGFFLKKFKDDLATLMLEYVQRRMAKVLPLLASKKVYLSAKDGYPAGDELKVVEEQASVLFHFIESEGEKRYYATVRMRGERVPIRRREAFMPSIKPAWMVMNGELFAFKEGTDGRKLKPFLQKNHIVIPEQSLDTYYRKFVTNLLSSHSVRSELFNVFNSRETPAFVLRVEETGANSLSLHPEVQYGEVTVSIFDEEPVKVRVEELDGQYAFYKVKRELESEEAIKKYLDKNRPNPASITPWQYVEREAGIEWLLNHASELQKLGMVIEQEAGSRRAENNHIRLESPVIDLTTEDMGDWFDVRAVVKIGEFEIPFIKFRPYILAGKREYRLPDGSVCLLPEAWFSDYRHLMEVSEEHEDGGFRLQKYQAPLLNFPSWKNQEELDLMTLLGGKKALPVVNTPEGLRATLRNYQQEGLNWLGFLRKHGIGGILADDMGLGKTLQTLTLLLSEKEEGRADCPSLVVAPTSLLHNWLQEAHHFVPGLRVLIHSGINRVKEPSIFSDYDLVLSSYGIVRQDIDFLSGFPFHYVVLDEAQNIKNPGSKTARAVRKLASRHRLALTGTPVENTIMDLWSQMAFLNPGLLGGETFFKKFYVQPIEKQQDDTRQAKLQRIMYPYILRRKKNEVEKELPPKIERLHYCGMEPLQEEYYEQTLSEYRNYFLDLLSKGDYRKNKINILVGLQKLRQLAIHPKLADSEKFSLEDSGKYQEVKRLLHQVISKGAKVLIFSQFVKMLELLRQDLDDEGIDYCYLDGSTRDRAKQVDRFQQDESVPVFLISLKAGGVGLNLTAAEYVFLLDPWWNPAVEHQAVDRSHRIGQKKTVIYYKFITENSIEEKILKLQQKKSKLSEDLISVDEGFYQKMSEEEMAELLGESVVKSRV